MGYARASIFKMSIDIFSCKIVSLFAKADVVELELEAENAYIYIEAARFHLHCIIVFIWHGNVNGDSPHYFITFILVFFDLWAKLIMFWWLFILALQSSADKRWLSICLRPLSGCIISLCRVPFRIANIDILCRFRDEYYTTRDVMISHEAMRSWPDISTLPQHHHAAAAEPALGIASLRLHYGVSAHAQALYHLCLMGRSAVPITSAVASM